MSARVLVIGAGGHAKVVAEALLGAGVNVAGFVDADTAKWGSRLVGIEVLGGDDLVLGHKPLDVQLANGIGSVASTTLRREIFMRFRKGGYRFVTVVHAAAIVSPSAELGEGAQIMAGAVLQANASIGANSIVNTGALIDHDCRIGEHCHVAPGAVLSGDVTLGDESHVGTGASIIQGVQIGRNVLIAAGSTVVRRVTDGQRVMGVPAREVAR